MKNIPIIGKFIVIMAIFGAFSLAVAIYGSLQVKHIDEANTALLDSESKAALMMARANRALQAARGSIGDLMIARTEERNAAALAELQGDKAKFEEFMGKAMVAMPENAALGRLKDEGRIRPEQVSVGKLNNVREAIKIARQCRTLLGANGITLEYPVMRHAGNLESVLTYEGTSEVHQLVIGEALTGVSAFR